MTRDLRVVLSALLVSLAASAEPAPQPAPPAGSPAPPAQTSPPAEAPPPSLPPGIEPGRPSTIEVPGDKPLYVIHAPASDRRVLVYLHGMCGKVESVESWRLTSVAHGTLIALLGDKKCPNGRSKWSKDTEKLHERIERAIQVVKQERGGLLDENDLMLIGYSQGAARSYRLAQLYPERYARLVLGGPPETPSTEYLGQARAIAVLGGELETTERMREGTAHLQEAGKLARYFMLPASKHGEYGPEAESVMTEVLDWLGRVAPYEG